MLVYDPAKRIHAVQALDHPYFNSLDKSLYDKYDVTRENKENTQGRVNV
jgi:cyclin-dependent kinase